MVGKCAHRSDARMTPTFAGVSFEISDGVRVGDGAMLNRTIVLNDVEIAPGRLIEDAVLFKRGNETLELRSS